MRIIGTILVLLGAFMLLSFFMKGFAFGIAFIAAGLSIIMHHIVPICSILFIIIGWSWMRK